MKLILNFLFTILYLYFDYQYLIRKNQSIQAIFLRVNLPALGVLGIVHNVKISKNPNSKNC